MKPERISFWGAFFQKSWKALTLRRFCLFSLAFAGRDGYNKNAEKAERQEKTAEQTGEKIDSLISIRTAFDDGTGLKDKVENVDENSIDFKNIDELTEEQLLEIENYL